MTTRDQKLAEVLVEFAHTLGTEFSIQGILDRLVQRVADVLPITAAGVMVMKDNDELHFAAASNDRILEIQSLQNEYDEGPCLEAYRTGQPVLIPDLSTDDRFPQFSPRAVAAGLAAVFTFPMRLDGERLGALDLYRDEPGALSAGDERAAQVLADVAAAYLFNARSRNEAAENLATMQHRSLHDALTGLPNRVLLGELLEHAVARARRSHLSAAVLFVDLDDFKSVNDRFGHHVGDLMLLRVAARLTEVLRAGDVLARLAGDEFVILCEDLRDPAYAEQLADRISEALEPAFELDGRRVSMTASVGVAYSGAGEDLPEHLLRAADFAMYEAKAAGGGRHRVVDRIAQRAADGRFQLEDDLRGATERAELRLDYQPIAQAGDGELVGVEALLRWEHPAHGLVTPDVVIPIAERTGLILPIGEWVLRQACTDFVRWRSQYGTALRQLAVNVSAYQVMGPAFAMTVKRILAETGIEPECLHLEVTESVFLDHAARARAVLGEIKSLGVRFSLDDFGTGYSSLIYLKRFPFDVLKIDRNSIAEAMGDEVTNRAIVGSVIELARALRLTVVAEGIETSEQLAQIVDLGGELAQGFYLSPPLAADQFEAQILEQAGSSAPVTLPRG